MRVTLPKKNTQLSNLPLGPCACRHDHARHFMSQNRSQPLLPQSQQHANISLPSTSLSSNLHYPNLQSSITQPKLNQITQFLTQINTKHHSKLNPTIKNNNRPPQSTNQKFRIPPNPNLKPHKSSPTLNKTLKFPTLTQNPSSKQPLPQKISQKPNLHSNPPQSNLVKHKNGSKKEGKGDCRLTRRCREEKSRGPVPWHSVQEC